MLAKFPSGIAEAAGKPTARNKFQEDFRALQLAKDRAVLDRDWPLWAHLRTLRMSKRGTQTPDGYDALAEAVIGAADGLVHHPGPLQDADDHVTSLVEGCQAILAGYGARKRELGIIDYGDMVADAERLLRSDEGDRPSPHGGASWLQGRLVRLLAAQPHAKKA
jgi:hypothetical protein